MIRLRKVLCDAMRAHLGGKAPLVPEGGALLWHAFAALNEARQHGAHGPQPIALGEIDAFARLYRVPLRPDHVDVLRALDRVWMEHASAVLTGRAPAASLPPLTASALDMML